MTDRMKHQAPCKVEPAEDGAREHLAWSANGSDGRIVLTCAGCDGGLDYLDASELRARVDAVSRASVTCPSCSLFVDHALVVRDLRRGRSLANALLEVAHRKRRALEGGDPEQHVTPQGEGKTLAEVERDAGLMHASWSFDRGAALALTEVGDAMTREGLALRGIVGPPACDCGASKGLRSDHGAECAAAYLHPPKGTK